MITVKTTNGMKITCESLERAKQIASEYNDSIADNEKVTEYKQKKQKKVDSVQDTPLPDNWEQLQDSKTEDMIRLNKEGYFKSFNW